MAPGKWADNAQTTWLESWMADFIKRQAEKKLYLFWSPMQEQWFKKWPEHGRMGLPLPDDSQGRKLTPDELKDLGEAIDVRKGQLENWFRNNRRKKIGNAGGDATAASNSTVQAMLKVPAAKNTL